MDDKKKTKDQQDFIVETPIVIEEKLGKGTDKVLRYERGKFLGKGGFAKCYEMKCVDTKKIYAAKVFEKKALTNMRSRKKLINEIKLHKKLHHQNIVNFEHFFEDKDNVYILLELCSNQTLNELLKRRKRLTEIEVQCYLIQIIKALKYIHNHKIIHRDLKLGNCFITNKLELKLGDFGLAAKLEYDGQRRRTVCGTPNYIAPEILEKKNGHSYEVDVWSLGVVGYTLLFGKPPYETSDVKLTYKKIKMNNYSFPDIKVHPSAKKLISSILNLDPSKRPSLDSILDHEFFKIYNSVPILLPLSTLACPPSSKYLSQFNNSEGSYNNNNFNNTFTNLQYKYNPSSIMNNVDFNNNINMNSTENVNINNNLNINNHILNHLLESKNNMNPVSHRKSESCGNNFDINDGNFIEKVNQILQNVNNNVNNSTSSRNVNKHEINFNTEKNLINNKITNFTKEDLISSNIVSNNFFVNLGNIPNLELNESMMKKLNSEGFINNIKTVFNPITNKMSKVIDYTAKFGYIYFVNNSHIGICFNDFSNIVKNFTQTESNANFQYIYLDKDGKNSLNFDDVSFENYIKNKSGSSTKDLIKKFEIFKHILSKHANEIKIDQTQKNFTFFYVKKFLKVQHATLFRLSNKIIQVSFVDGNELVMSTEGNDFLFKNKNGDEKVDTIQNIMSSDNTDLIKRIKFAKNLLIHFVKNSKSKKVPK